MLTPCQTLPSVTLGVSRSARQRLFALQRTTQNLALFGSWWRCNVKHLHKQKQVIRPSSLAAAELCEQTCTSGVGCYT